MAKIATALLILTLCTGQRSSAQIQISPLMLKDTSVSELYLNVKNKVRITGLKYGDKVLFADKPATRLDSNVYILAPTYPSEHTLVVKNKSGITYSKDFSVLKFPEVHVRLDTIRGTYATVEEVLASPNLIVETGNLKDWISIIAFDLGIQSKAGYDATPTMLSKRLSVYQTDLVKQLKAGDKLFFENIKATCPSCAIRALMPFTIIIK